MARDPSQREWQRQRTKEALQRAAVALFEAHGYDAVTVEQIAAEVGVSGRTFFRYFPNKEDVLLEATTATDPAFAAAVRAMPPHVGPIEAVRLAIREILAGLGEPALTVLRRALGIAVAVPALRVRLTSAAVAGEALIVEVLTTRMGDAARAELAAAAIIAVEQAVLGRWAREGCTGDVAAAMDEGLLALQSGFAASDALAPRSRGPASPHRRAPAKAPRAGRRGV